VLHKKSFWSQVSGCELPFSHRDSSSVGHFLETSRLVLPSFLFFRRYLQSIKVCDAPLFKYPSSLYPHLLFTDVVQ
jgi:hypothetical protein